MTSKFNILIVILVPGETREDISRTKFAALQKPFQIQNVVSLLERVRARQA